MDVYISNSGELSELEIKNWEERNIYIYINYGTEFLFLSMNVEEKKRRDLWTVSWTPQDLKRGAKCGLQRETQLAFFFSFLFFLR